MLGLLIKLVTLSGLLFDLVIKLITYFKSKNDKVHSHLKAKKDANVAAIGFTEIKPEDKK